MAAAIIQAPGFVQFNTEEAFEVSVKPAVAHGNPFSDGPGGLFKTISGKHKYKMLHLNLPKDVLLPQADCSTWSPSAKMFVTDDHVECGYFEVNESMCPDEYLASCLHNISSAGKRVEDIMTRTSSPIDAITAALVSGIQTAIGSSIYKVSWFGDPNFGTGSYHSASAVNLMEERSTAERTRLVNMMQQIEGIDTIIRRRAGNGLIKYVDTNDGTLAGNMTLSTNIKTFLIQMRLQSSDVLLYWDQLTGGGGRPAYYLQYGLYRAYIDYLETLPGGSDNHRFIVDGTPVPGAYMFEGYPVFHWKDADLFDHSIGLKDPATGYSLNQRALFTIPQNLTLLTNLQNAAGYEDAGLMIQQSPDIRDKGLLSMFMTLGIGAGISHNSLLTVGYNSSHTYTTS